MRTAKEFKLLYAPTDKQALFHASTADELFYGGAAGGGKSSSVVIEAGLLCLEHPGIDCYLFRRTYPELEHSLIAEAWKWWSGIGKWNSSRHEWRFPNGSKMLFCHCNNEKDRYLYQGAEINALFIDELTHFSSEVVDYLRTRVRAERALNFHPRARFTGNPGGIGHSWVKQRYVDIEPYKLNRIEVASEALGRSKIITRQYIPARLTDNPHLTDDYFYQLELQPPALKRALLNGDWNTFEGQVFAEWRDDPEHYMDRRNTHVIEPFEIPRHWTRYRSYDWGYSKPFAVLWWALDEDGRAYLYRELYGASAANVGIKMTVEEQAARISELERNDGFVIGYADPAIWDASSGESTAQKMSKCGVNFLKGEHNRLVGKSEFHSRLRFDEQGIPMLYVFRSCREFIRTTPALVYSPTRVEDVDSNGEDHIYDATRYFLMAHKIAPELPPNQADYYKGNRDRARDYDTFLTFGR